MNGGMNRERFNDFLAETLMVHLLVTTLKILTLKTHSKKKLSPYSPFLNIQAISALKAAIKADISGPEIQQAKSDRQEARPQGIPLGQYRTQLLLEALHRNVVSFVQ